MNRLVQITVFLALLLSLASCGGSSERTQTPALTIEQRLTAVETAQKDQADHEGRIAALETQIKSLFPEADAPSRNTLCQNAPSYLIAVDLDKNAEVKISYFETDLDYVLRLYPVRIVQKEDAKIYKNFSPEQVLQNPVWFIAVGKSNSIWLTGQGVDTNKSDAPAAVVFPVFINQAKLALDLQIDSTFKVYKVYDSANLSGAVAWIRACGIKSADVAFFGGQYLLPSEFAIIHDQLPSLQPNK